MIAKLLPFLLALNVFGLDRRLKNIASGIGLLVAGGLFLLLAIVFCLISIFFALADMDHLIIPGLGTSGIVLLLALLAFVEGNHMMRKKPLRSRISNGKL